MSKKLTNNKIIDVIRHDFLKTNKFTINNQAYQYDDKIRTIIKKSVFLLNLIFVVTILLLIYFAIFISINDIVRYILLIVTVLAYISLTKIVINKEKYEDLNKYVKPVSKTHSNKYNKI